MYAAYGGNDTKIHCQNFPDSLPSPLQARRHSMIDFNNFDTNVRSPTLENKRRSQSFDMNSQYAPDQRDLEIVREFQMFVNDFQHDLYKIRSEIKNDINLYEQNIKSQLKEQN